MIEWDTGRAIRHSSLMGYDPLALTDEPITNRAERFSFYRACVMTYYNSNHYALSPMARKPRHDVPGWF
jgi:hypothetical protein